MASTVSITNTTTGKLPRLPVVRLKEAILGPDYELSVAFVSPKETHRLNKTYRGKDKPTNVLSFPLSSSSGELILDLATARPEAADFGMTPNRFFLFLVIHGMLHLKGLDHGSTMERQEKKFLKLFSR